MLICSNRWAEQDCGSKAQPAGVLYEEIQHALDWGARPDHLFWNNLSNSKLHAITFENLALNSRFSLTLEERAAFLQEALRQFNL